MIGLAVPLVATSAVAVQLPDAPSAVKAREQRQALIAQEMANTAVAELAQGRIPRFEPGLSETWTNFVSVLGSDAGAAAGADSSNTDSANPQQSLYVPNRRNPNAGFSSSLSERYPVPGESPSLQTACPPDACSFADAVMCCRTQERQSPFARYLKSRDAVPLTARDNLNSAVKNVADPFNLLTIGADAAIGVATDSHSVYGPGFEGISKYAGVSLTEDMTGEFFGTFLVPSLAHQDPHYHREPFMPIEHRILHAIVQVVWAQSYSGRPMFNYANIVGGIATAAVSNTFVPGPGRQGFGATAQRLAVAFAISPSGNLIEEFVPDIASRINLRVVIFQRILNTVSIEESGGGLP